MSEMQNAASGIYGMTLPEAKRLNYLNYFVALVNFHL